MNAEEAIKMLAGNAPKPQTIPLFPAEAEAIAALIRSQADDLKAIEKCEDEMIQKVHGPGTYLVAKLPKAEAIQRMADTICRWARTHAQQGQASCVCELCCESRLAVEFPEYILADNTTTAPKAN